MQGLNPDNAGNFSGHEQVVSLSEAQNFAKDIAHTVADEHKREIASLRGALAAAKAGTKVNYETKGKIMNIRNEDLNNAVAAVTTETVSSVKLMSGKALLKVITRVAESLVFSRMGWLQRIATSAEKKEFYVTLATYALVHAIKTGGFGLTKYRINHPALDYVTFAANTKLTEYVAENVLGGNFELVDQLFQAPEVSVAS